MKVLLTGATGFLGRHTLPVLRERYGEANVVGVSRRDADLMRMEEVDRLLETHRPGAVVHYAAYSGGIGANRAYPADFWFRNTVLTALMFEGARRHGVKKLVYPIGGCSYPARAASPMGEDQLWAGFPQAESAPYSTAKMAGTVAALSYRRQYGLDAVVIVPGNMYGEYDNFHPLDSHVVPAMIRRFHEARLDGLEEVAMWGTGRPERDFVHAGDVARTIPFFLERYSEEAWVNLSSGLRTPIRELAGIVAEATGYRGRVAWDATKPDGQMVKVFDTRRMAALGLSCPTPLRDGIARTVAWFQANHAARGDGIRL
jgi:GDP-L-fucose synthase